MKIAVKKVRKQSEPLPTTPPISKKIIFRLGELFCGPGGLALGAIRAKVKKGNVQHCIEHSWASDYDRDSCDTYISNLSPDEPETVICKNVSDLDIDSLPGIDAFSYGFPCNDFSIVGEKKGFNGSFGPLYEYGVKVINKFKPKFFVAENVGGLTSANEGKALKKILHDLESSGDGYCLTTHLYKFEEYNIPQTRHRIIIVGIAKKYNLTFKVPKPITKNKPVSALEAIEIPPIPSHAHNHEFTNQSKKVIERLKRIKPGENVWNANLPGHLKLNVKGARLSHIYRRLAPNKPSYTVTGSGGGGTHGYHWYEPRALTNRERARIQTFSDDFIFSGKKESVRKQIGMAVSPKMSEIIFNAILKTFADIKYPSTPFSIERQRTLF